MLGTPIVFIEIRNYHQLDAALQGLIRHKGADITAEQIDKLVRGEPERLRTEPYPPELPGQQYERTGVLAFSWSVERTSVDTWLVLNRARQKGDIYAEYVVGEPEDQADIHRGRWWTAREKIEQHLSAETNEVWAASLAERYNTELEQAN